MNTPITRALIAYGIDPMNTPQEVQLEHTPEGIYITQFARDDDGEIIIEDHYVKHTREFYPHPKP